MDMRALLRGIGVGLIAAVAVTSVSGVIARQQGGDTLFSRPGEVSGMTETAMPQSDEDPKASETPKTSEAPKASETPKTSEAPKTSAAPEASAAPKASQGPETSAAPKASETPKASAAPKAAGDRPDQASLSDQEVYTLQITRGMESYHVAKALAKEGIVPDVQSFNKYLAAQPISENMQVGSYDIPYTATYEQIVEILEGKTSAQAILHGGSK